MAHDGSGKKFYNICQNDRGQTRIQRKGKRGGKNFILGGVVCNVLEALE